MRGVVPQNVQKLRGDLSRSFRLQAPATAEPSLKTFREEGRIALIPSAKGP